MNEIEKLFACCVLKVIQSGYELDMNNPNINQIYFIKGSFKWIYIECGENYVLMYFKISGKIINIEKIHNDEELNKISEKIKQFNIH